MGAYFRFQERAVERKLRAEATSGVIKPTSEATLGLLPNGERVTDRRTLIPVLGLREYWYPALAAKQVPKGKPLYWRMLGEEICFFRGEHGEIGAINVKSSVGLAEDVAGEIRRRGQRVFPRDTKGQPCAKGMASLPMYTEGCLL